MAESSKEICLDISNVFDEGNTKIQYYLLDDEHNAELFKEEKFKKHFKNKLKDNRI